MEIRTPIIAIMTLSILLIVYLRKSVPKISSSRIFFGFLVVAFLNTLAEILECAVFIYLNNSFYVLRRATQVFYCSTILICAYLIVGYVYSKVTLKIIVSNRSMAIVAIPAIVAIGFLLFGDVRFARNVEGYYYNYGQAINIAYFVGFAYVLFGLVLVIMYRGRLSEEAARVLIISFVIWAFMAYYQYYNHGLQVSAMAIMLMALMVFIFIENPREFYEKEISNILNRDAFISMIREKYAGQKNFYIMSVIFTGKSNVLSGNDRRTLYDEQSRIGQMVNNSLGCGVYLLNWNTLVFVVNNPSKVEVAMNIVSNTEKIIDANYRKTFCLIEAPKYAKGADEAIQILSYISEEYVYTQSSPNLVIDDMVVDRMIFRNNIEDIVRQAVKDRAFDVYYQPILNVKDGDFSSAEALVRLKRPDNERYISPEDFIPIAEKCGIVHDIDDIVFEKVCSFISREKLSTYGIKVIEVNLSGTEVVDPRTYDRLIHKMEKYNIPPNFINFEITETSYINNDEAFKENVRKLKNMGSTFSMDDFGSGYSNLLEILKMDYMLVKMDKEFVWNCLDKNKPENMRMLEYTIGFLKDYGLHILAEGVENIEQAKILIDKGVEYLQGFYYSRPIPEDEYIEFLKAQKGIFNKGE